MLLLLESSRSPLQSAIVPLASGVLKPDLEQLSAWHWLFDDVSGAQQLKEQLETAAIGERDRASNCPPRNLPARLCPQPCLVVAGIGQLMGCHDDWGDALGALRWDDRRGMKHRRHTAQRITLLPIPSPRIQWKCTLSPLSRSLVTA
jgi:hypothetical protein